MKIRSPDTVMRLARMGSFHHSRLSFMRTLLRRIVRERWLFERSLWEVDANGVGRAVYTVHTPRRPYSLVAFAQDLPDDMRSDRVIATAWDATFTLFDGIPSEADLQRLAANVPKQEAGRISDSELTLARANRSVRLWSHVVERLAAGEQPDAEQVEAVGYLMRTTAVYGSGKFGAADRAAIADRDELKSPFRAEMLTVWLIRAFTLDLAEHLARERGGERAASVAPELRRRFGVGNSTGLGMAPFLVSHPVLLHRWMAAREEALARVRAVEHATPQAMREFHAALADARSNADSWHSAHPLQIEKVTALRADLDLLAQHLESDALAVERPWDRLYNWASEHLSLEGQEQLVSLLMEPYAELVDALAEDMDADELAPFTLDGSMLVARLRQLVELHYAWATAIDFATSQGRARFWYVSEEKLEPRLGERARDDGAEFELPLCTAELVQALMRDLRSWPDDTTVADFMLAQPAHRQVVRRVQAADANPFAEIHDNLIASDMLPIDMLRCKLSFFGATRFDPRSDRWVRISMYQGAPFPHELCAAPAASSVLAQALGVGPQANATHYTLAEIESLSRRAARGAGFDWGLADEVGKAARWLASVGLSGPQTLAALLTHNDGKPFENLRPAETTGSWHARSGELCPLTAGAALIDRAEQLATVDGVRLVSIRYPLLILPFIARAASKTRRDLEVTWPGVRAICTADGLRIESTEVALNALDAPTLSVRAATTMAGREFKTSHASRNVDEASWATLTRLAHRTLVPASVASRADAGGSDIE